MTLRPGPVGGGATVEARQAWVGPMGEQLVQGGKITLLGGRQEGRDLLVRGYGRAIAAGCEDKRSDQGECET
jgi:hypothetical protein